MKMEHWCALLLACNLAIPLWGQQKTYNWVPSDDETVRLDPGYYHGGPTFQPSPRMRDVHVDVDAQQPVTISMLLAQEWNDAAQHPEAVRNLHYICVQEHVIKATYSCAPPSELPVVIVVRDERGSEYGSYFGFGEVIERHERSAHDTERAVGVATALLGHPIREFVSPNRVRLQYYEWSCVNNCSLPDPPLPKMFDWVRAEAEIVRLDPANYFTSRTYRPGPQGGNMQVDIEALYPVTIAMVDPTTWSDATERPNAVRNVNNIDYACVQQHVVKARYSCHLGGFWPQALVIRDEREAAQDQRKGDQAQGKTTNPTNPPQVIPVSVAGAVLSANNPGRTFLYPNNVRIQYYSWNCVQSCDQPDFAWVQQVREKFELTKMMKIYGGLVPDHDGAQLSVKVKSPVPMAVAVLPATTAGQLYGNPGMFESAVASSSCQQRGVQSATLQCTLKMADGPQSLVLVPEAGVNIPNRKKAEVEVQSVKCVNNCGALPTAK